MTTLDGTVDLARDRELVERCQEGDEQAFAELFQRYQRRLHRFCVRKLHAEDEAEEAVQEAFARAWRALPRFAGERRFSPWLTVIAGNVCTDMLRRRSRTVPMREVPEPDVDVGVPEVDEHLLRQVDLALASAALGNLSDRHQRVLRLREATEWSAQRIAEHEGLAAPAVDTLLWRARQAFKREFAALSETGGGLAAVLGIGVGGLRRSAGRLSGRLSSALGPAASMPRGPGAIAATVAVASAAIAGGSVALVGAGPSHGATPTTIGKTVGPAAGSPAVGSPAAGVGTTGALGPAGTSRTTPTGTNGGAGRAPAAPLGNAAAGSVSGALGPGNWYPVGDRVASAGTLLRGLGALGGLGQPSRSAVPTSAPPAATTLGSAAGATLGRTVGAAATAVGSTSRAASPIVRTVLGGRSAMGDTSTGGTSTGGGASGSSGGGLLTVP